MTVSLRVDDPLGDWPGTSNDRALHGQVAFEDNGSEADFAILIVGAMPSFYRVSPNKQQRRCNQHKVRRVFRSVAIGHAKSGRVHVQTVQRNVFT